MKNLDKAIEIAKRHQEMDRFTQGVWLDDTEKVGGEFRGCFYGCMTQSENDPIESFCKEYDIPLWLGYYSKEIFEGISLDLAKKFPLELLESLSKLPDVFDFEILKSKIAIKRLNRLNEIVKFKKVNDALDKAISYHNDVVNGISSEQVAESAAAAAGLAFSEVESAADSAADSAAESAVWSVGGLSASAAHSAISAAESAAISAGGLARSAVLSAWEKERSDLLELLQEGHK